MSEIAGVTIDFTDYSAPATPRTINIPDAAGDVLVQDLWDTLSAQAALLDNLIYRNLIDRPAGGGKSILSPTKSVGITLMMNHLRLKFFDQPGPAYVIKRVLDGNLIAQDDSKVAIEPLQTSNFTNWKNEADVSAAIVDQPKVDDLHKVHGLDAATPLEITDTTRDAGAGVAQTISVVGPKTTVTRLP